MFHLCERDCHHIVICYCATIKRKSSFILLAMDLVQGFTVLTSIILTTLVDWFSLKTKVKCPNIRRGRKTANYPLFDPRSLSAFSKLALLQAGVDRKMHAAAQMLHYEPTTHMWNLLHKDKTCTCTGRTWRLHQHISHYNSYLNLKWSLWMNDCFFDVISIDFHL